jgi:hypothetical protein
VGGWCVSVRVRAWVGGGGWGGGGGHVCEEWAKQQVGGGCVNVHVCFWVGVCRGDMYEVHRAIGWWGGLCAYEHG